MNVLSSSYGSLSTDESGQEQIKLRGVPSICPTCESPDPAKHPAMQFEGEVQICRDEWHALVLASQSGNWSLATNIGRRLLCVSYGKYTVIGRTGTAARAGIAGLLRDVAATRGAV